MCAEEILDGPGGPVGAGGGDGRRGGDGSDQLEARGCADNLGALCQPELAVLDERDEC